MPCGNQAFFYAKTAIKWEIVTAKARKTANKAALFKRMWQEKVLDLLEIKVLSNASVSKTIQ